MSGFDLKLESIKHVFRGYVSDHSLPAPDGKEHELKYAPENRLVATDIVRSLKPTSFIKKHGVITPLEPVSLLSTTINSNGYLLSNAHLDTVDARGYGQFSIHAHYMQLRARWSTRPWLGANDQDTFGLVQYSAKSLVEMERARRDEIEHCVPQFSGYQQFLELEKAGKNRLPSFFYNTINPDLLVIAANYNTSRARYLIGVWLPSHNAMAVVEVGNDVTHYYNSDFTAKTGDDREIEFEIKGFMFMDASNVVRLNTEAYKERLAAETELLLSAQLKVAFGDKLSRVFESKSQRSLRNVNDYHMARKEFAAASSHTAMPDAGAYYAIERHVPMSTFEHQHFRNTLLNQASKLPRPRDIIDNIPGITKQEFDITAFEHAERARVQALLAPKLAAHHG